MIIFLICINFFSYTKQAQLISDRFRDQPLTPLETAIHYVKHVAKNKGAPHLRSVAVDLPFYALYNLDVWAFIFFVISTVMFGLIFLTGAIIKVLSPSFWQEKIKTS